MTVARRQRATPPPPPRPEPTPPSNLTGMAHVGGTVKSLPVFLVLHLPHSAVKIAAVLDSLCNGEDSCRWESQRTLREMTGLVRSTFAEGMRALRFGVPERHVPPLLKVTRETLYPGKRPQAVYWPRWRQPDRLDMAEPGPRPGPGMEGPSLPQRRPDSRAPSRPDSRASEAAPAPDRARNPGFEPSGNPGAPSYGSVFPTEETPEREPLTACASPGGADPGPPAPPPRESPPGPSGDELLEADLASLPAAERERLVSEATAALPPSLRRFRTAVDAEVYTRLRARDPGRYAAAEAAAAASGPRAPEAVPVYKHPEARRLHAITADDAAAVADLAAAIAEKLEQEDSTACFAAIVGAALDGRRKLTQVARKIDLALEGHKRPEILPSKYRRWGDVRAAGWMLTDVVYHHMPGPSLKEDASPRGNCTRTGDEARSEVGRPSRPRPRA